mgnify:CR=1 FL=1
MGVELLLIIRARAYQSLLEDNVVIVSAPFFFGAYGNTQMKKQKIMDDPTCSYPCLMKLDLQSSTNKLAFLKDNWPSFGQIESIDRLSETELRCTLCLLDVVLAALAKDECFCPNREIIRLVLTRTYVQNRCELCETEEIRSKLVKGFCTREKKNGLSRKNNIRRRGISVFYGAILRMLSLFSSFRKEENRDTTDF